MLSCRWTLVMALVVFSSAQAQMEIPGYTGTITSFALPDIAGSPFRAKGGSKHTNMAYSPTTKRLYVQGGDWTHSATDGTWSMSLADGTWRQDVGKPEHPNLPAPHALQDGAGFEWVADRHQFLIRPGAYFPYEPEGTLIRDYSRGMWWFDPATNKYTQELGLFGKYGQHSGCLHGGVYDEVHDQIVVLMDSSLETRTRRWSVAKLEALPDVKFQVSVPAAHPAAKASYFTRGKYAKIGRHVYVVGYATNGNKEVKIPRLWRWDLDKLTIEELAPPPVKGALITDLNVRLGASHGKVVWPFTNGPEGTIHGIYIYDPETNIWALDKQVPDYGNFIGNSICSLPDGRIAFSGGAFGLPQTHIWFYEARP